MGDSELRIPKGILKASKYGGNSNSRDGLEVGEHQHHQQMSYSTAYGGGGWDPQLGMPVAPVPAPNHGMNMPNPVLDPILRGIKSEFPNMHLKVNEFISKKRELIFRPLDPDETPVSEVKGDQRNVEDHYAVLPSLDQFLRVDRSEIIRYFYKNAQAGDLLIGRVISSNSTGVTLRLICTDGGKQVVLDDFSLRAFCPNSQSLPNPDSRDPRTYYDDDEYIRVEILDVNSQSEKLVVGMKGINLSTEMQHAYTLGVIRQSDLPRYYTLSVKKRTEDPRSHRHSYQDMLLESPGFQNPSSISHLARNMGLYNNSNSLIKGVRNGFPATEKASHLRRVQNAKWAHGHVAEGIKFYKAQKFTEAFQCLNSALNIDPENVEGLVARGALYANNGSFEKAIDDFESALKFNPNHFNARKYLAETLVALGRQQEHQGKLEDAIASYSKSLVVRSDHKEATEALLSLHARTEKLDPSKMTGPAAAKAAELKAKLKTILQGELGYKMERKENKEKKSKKDKKKRDSSASDDDSSSSSSSDDSSSDSSSSDGGYKKKSKKRKRKKSKKKKSKKESERKKKELSLSPFAKRLVEPGQVGMTGNSAFTSGFTDSTYTELQLGIPKREEESDESKRSSKKSKDKKRSKKGKDKKKKRKHASSDSSSSDSEGERVKKKGKKQATSENTSLQGIIPDLGDLEAKLSAYYSKIEQDKIETKAPSSARRSRSRSRDRTSRTRSPVERRKPRDYNDIPPRVVENIPPVVTLDDKREERQGERTQSKFSLETDDYGNLIQQQTIIRTVKNDAPAPVEPPKPMKFEMKFKPVIGVPSNEGENGTSKAPPPPPDLTSKWRPLGAAAPQSDAVKNAFQRESPARSTGSREDRDKRSPPERRYRRKSRSLSRSPVRRRRRSRSYSSRSRSRSRSYSRSRSRSRSRSPSFRRRFRGRDRDHGSRGRGAVRFFRGYNYNRGGGGGRRGGGYNPRPYNNSRDFGGGSKSRFRNRFSHTPSRSRSRSKSRSRSRSRSPSPRRRDRSPDRRASARDDSSSKPVPQVSDNRMEPDSASQPSEPVAPSEIQIGSLKTTSAADVEFLLDKRNAEKKEEMRKSNPEFFRAT